MRAYFGIAVICFVASASMVPPACAETKAVPAALARSMSPEAKAYLDEAIALFRKSHINAGKMDWPVLTARAYAAVAGARTTRDTYPAIQLIIQELGEKHTAFLDPDAAKAQSTGVSTSTASAPLLMLAEVAKLANGVGLVRLYGFVGSEAWARQYVAHGRSRIAGLQADGVCRFILDLRANGGGNMYPMLSALSPLLDDGGLGKFEYADGHSTYWGIKGGEASETEGAFASVAPIKAATLPVAVLLGPRTASSGEFTAMSFKGRANTRFFGSPTGGYVTGNDPMKLSDGAVIVMTDGWGVDRTGKKYVDVVLPDEDTGYGGPTLDAATDWLMHQDCHSRK